MVHVFVRLQKSAYPCPLTHTTTHISLEIRITATVTLLFRPCSFVLVSGRRKITKLRTGKHVKTYCSRLYPSLDLIIPIPHYLSTVTIDHQPHQTHQPHQRLQLYASLHVMDGQSVLQDADNRYVEAFVLFVETYNSAIVHFHVPRHYDSKSLSTRLEASR